MRGTVLGREVELRGLVDESEGRHARETSWWWSCGVGETADGRAVTWNLVDGLHDGADESERCVWLDGEPAHVPPQAFRGFDGVGGLAFEAVATRARRGGLRRCSCRTTRPRSGGSAERFRCAGDVRSGCGVMERHAARW